MADTSNQLMTPGNFLVVVNVVRSIQRDCVCVCVSVCVCVGGWVEDVMHPNATHSEFTLLVLLSLVKRSIICETLDLI